MVLRQLVELHGLIISHNVLLGGAAVCIPRLSLKPLSRHQIEMGCNAVCVSSHCLHTVCVLYTPVDPRRIVITCLHIVHTL